MSNMCRSTTARKIIHIKVAVYREYIKIETTMANITFIGDGIDKTVDTGNKMWRIMNRQPLVSFWSSVSFPVITVLPMSSPINVIFYIVLSS